MTVEELERTLNQLIENEQYEEASRISAILKRKRNPDNQQ
ncbi:MAG: UvrB/UvrC motif-containing protein [Paramuribaculum sp.]|nr:UvrB/UvrC motif-containing protein [Paramuribaculum sp.]